MLYRSCLRLCLVAALCVIIYAVDTTTNDRAMYDTEIQKNVEEAKNGKLGETPSLKRWLSFSSQQKTSNNDQKRNYRGSEKMLGQNKSVLLQRNSSKLKEGNQAALAAKIRRSQTMSCKTCDVIDVIDSIGRIKSRFNSYLSTLIYSKVFTQTQGDKLSEITANLLEANGADVECKRVPADTPIQPHDDPRCSPDIVNLKDELKEVILHEGMGGGDRLESLKKQGYQTFEKLCANSNVQMDTVEVSGNLKSTTILKKIGAFILRRDYHQLSILQVMPYMKAALAPRKLREKAEKENDEGSELRRHVRSVSREWFVIDQRKKARYDENEGTESNGAIDREEIDSEKPAKSYTIKITRKKRQIGIIEGILIAIAVVAVVSGLIWLFTAAYKNDKAYNERNG